MGCTTGTIRYILFFFNFILALAGLGILIQGLLSAHYNDGATVKDILHAQLSTPSIVMATIGGCVFIFAFFGCCGALRESHCMITTYAVLLLTLFLLQVAVGVLIYTKRAQTEDIIAQAVELTYEKYSIDSHTTKVIDQMQQLFHCCGTRNNTIPWGDIKPDSCYSNGDRAATLFSEGCVPKIVNLAKEKLTQMGHVTIVVGVIEVLGIIFSLYLAHTIRRDEKRGYA